MNQSNRTDAGRFHANSATGSLRSHIASVPWSFNIVNCCETGVQNVAVQHVVCGLRLVSLHQHPCANHPSLFSRAVCAIACQFPVSMHHSAAVAPAVAPAVHHRDYLEAALVSALRNAPSLVPILIYDGPASTLTAWFEAMGGIVVFHHLSIYQELREAEATGHVAKGYADFVRGTYLRLDIPILFPRYVGPNACPSACAFAAC
jgi:hypothetical protein